MIRFVTGDLFATSAEALVNTVNCVGAMGRGVAEQVRDRWPATYAAYRADCGVGLGCDGRPDFSIGPRKEQRAAPCLATGAPCAVHRVRPGHIGVRETGDTAPRLVLEMPTKRHWNSDSLFVDVRDGLAALAVTAVRLRLRSIAMPPPGCGNGGLRWETVRVAVIQALQDVPGLDVDVHGQAPAGWRNAAPGSDPNAAAGLSREAALAARRR